MTVETMVATSYEAFAELRRRLHAAPELSEREIGTAAIIRAALESAGPSDLLTGLGEMETGVCAVFDSGAPGPTVLLRAELDALPIQETNRFAHRSQRDGAAHKCGHDGHMATLVAVADGLQRAPVAKGRAYLLFQPAEETGTGAAAVIADRRFRALAPPDAVYAFHNVPRYPLGRVLVRDGLFAQASVAFVVGFVGTTSHSSYPEHGVNPARAATALVDAVDRFGTDFEGRAPVLGTISYAEIGRVDSGTNFGTTPGVARIMGVLRAEHDDDLTELRRKLAALAEELAGASGLEHSVDWQEAFAATRSHPDCVAVVEAAAEQAGLIAERLDTPFRWSEDFGYFTSAYKGAFFGLGSGVDQPQLHDDGYDYPDELIEIGARLYRAIVDRHLA